MVVFRRIIAGLRDVFRKTRVEQELDDELRQFLEAAVEEKMQAGLSRQEAIRAARLELGSVAAVKDRVRDVGWAFALEQLLRDLRYAWRGLRRSRAFAATTVLTLAVGLGLVTVVFTVFNAYVLRPFAVRDPYSLHEIVWRSQEAAGRTFRWSDYEDFRARRDLFDAVMAESSRFVTSQGNTLSVGFVSGNYFEALGAPVLMGRGVAEYDTRAPGGAPVAVLSHQIWSRAFDRDPGVIGREIELNDQKFVIVGVVRAEFQGLDDTPQDLWLPVTMYGAVARQDLFANPQPRTLRIVARLRPEVTAARAQNALMLSPFESRVAGRLDAVRAELRVHATRVRLTVDLMTALAPVFSAFMLVLVAACANASIVMLARANARHREIGVRLALGASRGRVVRQLLTEGLLLSALAGVAGLAFADLALRAGTSLLFGVLPAVVSSLVRVVPLDFDYRVFLFAFGVAAAATLLFALLPALHATRLTLTDALRGQASPALRSSTLRNVLVGGQVAISLALLVVAATLVRNSAAIGAADLGFDPHGVFSINQRGKEIPTARMAAALTTDPRIEQVVVTSRNPLFGQHPKAPVLRDAGVVAVSYMFVSPEYFSMLRIPIVHGRGFRPEEVREGSGAAIVSAAGAKALWPGENPLGKTIRLQLEEPKTYVADTVKSLRAVSGDNPDSVVVTVVGVAKDVISGFVYEGKDAAHLYLPTTPEGPHAEALLVHGRPGANVRADTLRSLLQPVHPDPLVFETIPLEQMVAVQHFPLRIASWIGSFLGAVALALSVCGLYGVLSYTLSQREREIAIRMALGATAVAVVRLVMRQSARLAGLGAAIGLLFAFSVMKILSTFVRLDNVSVVDAGAFALGLVLVAIAVALASYGPARRATRVDPSLMLKSDG